MAPPLAKVASEHAGHDLIRRICSEAGARAAISHTGAMAGAME